LVNFVRVCMLVFVCVCVCVDVISSGIIVTRALFPRLEMLELSIRGEGGVQTIDLASLDVLEQITFLRITLRGNTTLLKLDDLPRNLNSLRCFVVAEETSNHPTSCVNLESLQINCPVPVQYIELTGLTAIRSLDPFPTIHDSFHTRKARYALM
jgi:hypothetical protein